MPPDFADIRQWLDKAEHDRITAEAVISLTRPITDTAAFHCQQAVEKCLKVYLVWREFPFEKIHDLEVLATQCSTFDSTFLTLVERVAPLTGYAVRFRYPGPNNPTVEDIRDALNVVNAVRQFVLDRLPPEAR